MEQHFYTLLDKHILNLNRKFRDKFSIRQSLYNDIVLVLRDGWGDSQLKFWVRKNFKLIRNGDENMVYEIQSNLPVVTYENLYTKIKECHETVHHRGRDKTWNEVKKHYAWIPMDCVKLFVSLCHTCTNTKATTVSKSLDNRTIFSHDYLTALQVDLINMHTIPDREYQWILYAEDHFTKFCWAYPLKSNDVELIAEKLLRQFYLFGAPCILQSTNGTEFLTQVIMNLKRISVDLIIINGHILHPYINNLTQHDNHLMFKTALDEWMESNSRRDWSNALLPVIYSMNTNRTKLANDKTPYEIVFSQKSNQHFELCQILLNHNFLNEENLQIDLFHELKRGTHIRNPVQDASNLTSSIVPSTPTCHTSLDTSYRTKKRRHLTPVSKEYTSMPSNDKETNNNNDDNNLVNKQQEMRPKTTDVAQMTDMGERQQLFNNELCQHQYKVDDLVGLIVDKVESANYTLKVLACKIISIQSVARDIYTYQLCTKSCIISSKFQASDLLNLSNCNYVDLYAIDSKTLPIYTFDEVCKSIS